MKAKYTVGQALYVQRFVKGHHLTTGTRIRVIEFLEEKGPAEPRYLVSSGSHRPLWFYEADLSPVDPLSLADDRNGAEGAK